MHVFCPQDDQPPCPLLQFQSGSYAVGPELAVCIGQADFNIRYGDLVREALPVLENGSQRGKIGDNLLRIVLKGINIQRNMIVENSPATPENRSSLAPQRTPHQTGPGRQPGGTGDGLPFHSHAAIQRQIFSQCPMVLNVARQFQAVFSESAPSGELQPPQHKAVYISQIDWTIPEHAPIFAARHGRAEQNDVTALGMNWS